jgi:hypothetical protein
MNEVAIDPEKKGMCGQKYLGPSCPVPHSKLDSVKRLFRLAGGLKRRLVSIDKIRL